MSCFIVSEKLLNDTINFIGHNLPNDDIGQCVTRYFFNDLMFKYDQCPTKEDLLKEITKNLSIQNNLSWNSRYPNNQVEIESNLHNFKYDYRKISIAQFLKNLDCIEYQSCETSDYYESESYKLLKYIRHWATTLIDGYEQAKWGY